MLIRVNVDSVTRHYCIDCATQVPEAAEGHWVGKGVCCECSLVGGAKGRRVKQAQAGPALPVLTEEELAAEQERLMLAVTGTGDEED